MKMKTIFEHLANNSLYLERGEIRGCFNLAYIFSHIWTIVLWFREYTFYLLFRVNASIAVFDGMKYKLFVKLTDWFITISTCKKQGLKLWINSSSSICFINLFRFIYLLRLIISSIIMYCFGWLHFNNAGILISNIGLQYYVLDIHFYSALICACGIIPYVLPVYWDWESPSQIAPCMLITHNSIRIIITPYMFIPWPLWPMLSRQGTFEPITPIFPVNKTAPK